MSSWLTSGSSQRRPVPGDVVAGLSVCAVNPLACEMAGRCSDGSQLSGIDADGDVQFADLVDGEWIRRCNPKATR